MSGSINVDDRKEIQKDLLWGLYQEYRNHARHAETLRSNINNYVMLISSALITLVTFDDKIDRSDLPLSLIIALLGFLGALFSVSYTERYNRHRLRSSKIRDQLDKMFFPTDDGIGIKILRDEADKLNNQVMGFDLVRKFAGTHFFWVILPLVVFLIGLFLAYLALSA